ncbi:ABC transporter substrate-binding protein [Maribacter vaceletii]|uniref:ABC transporter substrate-binding protein n=1 Tax=Maribacter vaceletii TaxID=1206816 RepID=UPI0014732DBF|nr:ABC transporter substrate-binding protein [Maribacter vaceletii]
MLFICLSICSACQSDVKVINIGYIGPLTKRATDLGIGPANALKIAVEEYNRNKKPEEPVVNLFIEDDQWEKDNAIITYEKLRREQDINIIFISNSEGTIAISDKALEDGVILVNPLNNDALLSKLNSNTFKIAKSTEQANSLIAIRIIELGLKKVAIMNYPNDFMTIASTSCKKLLDKNGIKNKIVTINKEATDFEKELKSFKKEGYDAYVFFGYKNFGFAMKQARELGITAPFFGSTVLLDPAYYENSQGTIVGTECTFFTPADGNWVLANEFLDTYKLTYGEKPFSVWPPLQAYDAMNLVLNEVKTINDTKNSDQYFDEWLRQRLNNVKFFQGTCGNISIGKNGASKGIYFSLYNYESKGSLIKVKR